MVLISASNRGLHGDYRIFLKWDTSGRMTEHRRYSPAAARNRTLILDVLRQQLPKSGSVLEIASGTGEHIVHFAAGCPDLTFQPTDPSPDALNSIAAWIEAEATDNVKPPLALDVLQADWPVQACDAVYCSNMIHIAPWTACEGLIAGSARVLRPGGLLFLYGPFFRAGVETAPGNIAFDRDLRGRNPDWGIRHLDAVAERAAMAGFDAPEITEMPANNLCVAFRLNAGTADR